MDHALSILSSRSERLSPAALALAVLLHGLVVLALWAMSVYAPRLPPVEDVIEVSLEPPPPPPPPKPPPQQTAPVPLIEPGLRPPAAITADRPTQALPPALPLARTPP
ncbi:MAG: hypothetical protein K2Y40_02355, partial [Reyranella sp.]|nr:hypothetical protein [Reyranella sp.]